MTSWLLQEIEKANPGLKFNFPDRVNKIIQHIELDPYEDFTYELTEDEKAKYKYHTESAIKTIKYIQNISSDIIQKAAGEAKYYVVDGRLRENLLEIKNKIGTNINHNWLASAVAEEAMKRGYMEEDDFFDLDHQLS